MDCRIIPQPVSSVKKVLYLTAQNGIRPLLKWETEANFSDYSWVLFCTHSPFVPQMVGKHEKEEREIIEFDQYTDCHKQRAKDSSQGKKELLDNWRFNPHDQHKE